MSHDILLFGGPRTFTHEKGQGKTMNIFSATHELATNPCKSPAMRRHLAFQMSGLPHILTECQKPTSTLSFSFPEATRHAFPKDLLRALRLSLGLRTAGRASMTDLTSESQPHWMPAEVLCKACHQHGASG